MVWYKLGNPHLYFSIVLFVIFALFLRKKSFSAVNSITLFFLSIVYILLFLLFIISDSFTANGIDESVIFHLKYGLAGASFLSELKLILLSSIVLLFGVYYFSHLLFVKNNKYFKQPKRTFLLYLLVLLALSLHPAVHDLYKLNKGKRNTFSHTMDFNYFYRAPYIKKIKNTSKNLVVIYGEGFESTYFDNDIFPDLIKDLHKLKSKRVIFSNITQADGTRWTIAGLVSSQCGIPLIGLFDGNSMSGVESFLESAVCLGDLLHNEDYKLIFYGGAKHSFAGKGKFLKTHKFDEIYGKKELRPLLADKSYLNNWGIHDDTLFDFAYERFIQLSMNDQNFGLFLLTVGTHHPDGFIADRCKGKTYKHISNPMLNAVTCSDYLISEFINRILLSPYAKETVIVLQSDHLSWKNSASKLLSKGDRKNLFMIIDSSIEKTFENSRLGSTLDIAPTLLPFMGFEGAIGLGVNLMASDRNEEETKLLHNNILDWKDELLKFWNFPTITEFISIDKDKQQFSVDNSTFKYPALIIFDNEFKTKLLFGFDRTKKGTVLLEVTQKLWKEDNFILIDECSKLNKVDELLGQDGYCVSMGAGKRHAATWILNNDIRMELDEILRIIKKDPQFEIHRIAHAGGGIDSNTYTNSFEALNYNLKRGFTYFEIDFSFTADNHLVCVHDFDKSFARVSGVDFEGRPTINQFDEIIDKHSEYEICSLDSLTEWLEINPSATLITDVKDDNLNALNLIMEKIPNYKNRVIPQIYDPENYATVKDLGFNQIIWTLYRYNGTNEDVYRWAFKFEGPFAITMPKIRAKTKLPRYLAEKNIPTYVHTINSEEDANRLINDYGIKDIYTDFLPPND